jgi:hypothetical protein
VRKKSGEELGPFAGVKSQRKLCAEGTAVEASWSKRPLRAPQRPWDVLSTIELAVSGSRPYAGLLDAQNWP